MCVTRVQKGTKVFDSMKCSGSMVIQEFFSKGGGPSKRAEG